jgi:branched-chain amino acid transport system ATP-binding protein
VTGPGVTLRARGVARSFGGVHAVDGVDLDAVPGSITALIGPNGAGKTTLFACISGVQRPDRGRVLLGGRDITGAGVDARARLGLARTFQELSVFAGLPVADNIRVGAENRRPGGVLAGLLGLPDPARRDVDAAVDRVLGMLDLGRVRDRPAGELSTGTLRMVELGRALASDPAAMLLDEPASGLDDAEIGALRGVLRDLADSGRTIVLVEHDVALVFDVADRVYVMAGGTIVAAGTPAEVAADRAALDVYLDPAGQ